MSDQICSRDNFQSLQFRAVRIARGAWPIGFPTAINILQKSPDSYVYAARSGVLEECVDMSQHGIVQFSVVSKYPDFLPVHPSNHGTHALQTTVPGLKRPRPETKRPIL
jgi:hypothetical protein